MVVCGYPRYMERSLLTPLSELRALSKAIAANPLWIQGAGGNTSFKSDNTLWVKSSGTWLAHADSENAFIPIDLTQTRQSLSLVYDNTVSCMRPSIEALLHAVMPHRVVCHTHAISALSWVVRSDAKECLEALLAGLRWAFIPYSKPGEALARAAQETLAQAPDVLVLENHGLVVGSEDCAGALALLNTLEARLQTKVRPHLAPDWERLTQNVSNRPDFTVPSEPICHFAAQDALAYALSQRRALYPDHVVFLHDKIHPFPGKAHSEVLLCPEQGILVHQKFSAQAMQMLTAFAQLARRLSPDMPLKHLSAEEEYALCHWEAEHYRQAKNRQTV